MSRSGPFILWLPVSNHYPQTATPQVNSRDPVQPQWSGAAASPCRAARGDQPHARNPGNQSSAATRGTHSRRQSLILILMHMSFVHDTVTSCSSFTCCVCSGGRAGARWSPADGLTGRLWGPALPGSGERDGGEDGGEWRLWWSAQSAGPGWERQVHFTVETPEHVRCFFPAALLVLTLLPTLVDLQWHLNFTAALTLVLLLSQSDRGVDAGKTFTGSPGRRAWSPSSQSLLLPQEERVGNSGICAPSTPNEHL